MALPSMPDIAALSNKKRKVPGAVQIKEEKPEDAEICALAAKMVEANKAKMAVASAATAVTGRGPGILAYINRRPASTGTTLGTTSPAGGGTPVSAGVTTPGTTSSPAPPTSGGDQSTTQEKPPFDLSSQRGKFGWVQMGDKHIPYIFRGEDKYCAVRMVENKLLVKYLNCLNSDIYNCTCIRSYYITENEARLLTEINGKHCEGKFGAGAFTTRDLVVRLKDADEFYSFLEFCYGKLTQPVGSNSNAATSGTAQRCGFIRINSESVVPYALTQDKQFVPLFYFDGETDTLKDKAVSLEGWDLAYLKFCCKVQGIRSELFESDTCVCISLDHIKNYFAGGTIFEEYWPPKLVESSLLVGVNQRTERGRYASWTKAPPPQPSPPATAASVPIAIQPSPASQQPAQAKATNGWPPSSTMASRYYRQSHLPPPTVRNNSINQLNHLVSNTSIQQRYAVGARLQQTMANSHYYPSATQSHTSHNSGAAPPALVRVTAPPATHLSQTANYSTSNIVMQQNSSIGMMSGMMPPPPGTVVTSYTNSTNNNNSSTHKNYAPPPLIPVNGTNPRYYSGGGGGGTDVIDLSSPPQSPQRAALLPNGSAKQLQQQGAAASILQQQQPRSKRLIQISETPSRQHLSHYPFKMQKALVNGKMVPCINAKAYIYSDLLMTVNDLLEHFFPQVPVSKCREVLQDVLNVDLFAGNTQQKTVLRENNKIKSLADDVPLIQLKDVITYMPQLTYVMGRMSPSSLGQEDCQAKRQRVS